MKKVNETKLTKMLEAIEANNGIMPESWLPFAEILIFGLKVAKFFTNDKTDVVIDKIITAIELSID